MVNAANLRSSGNRVKNVQFYRCHNNAVKAMNNKVLIVEDEFIVALSLQQTLSDLGFETVGIAADAATAKRLAEEHPDYALVDVNLRDGATGPLIGQRLAEEHGVVVLFLTANPAQLGEGIRGTVGVLSKPIGEEMVERALDFLVNHRLGKVASPPPAMRLFANDNNIGRANATRPSQK